MTLFSNVEKLKVSKLEELTRNAWPAFEEINHNGWILRFAQGYRQRGNSVWTEHYSGNDIEKDIDEVERIYADRKIQPLFKVTSYSDKELLDRLENRNYSAGRETLVMMRENVSLSCSVNYQTLKCTDDEWISMNKESDDEAEEMFRKILSLIKSNVYFVKIYSEKKPAGSFYFVVEQGYAGLYSLYIKRDFRKLGLGESSLNIINELSGNTAQYIYLQVEKDNLPAVQMYRKNGFSVIYNYIYLSKNGNL